MVTGKFRRLFPILLCSAVMLAGCGQGEPEAPAEEIELLEPVGVGLSYEAAARRNLYEAEIYPALVCPHVEEYEMEESFAFGGFDAWPGEAVRKGDALLHADTEDIDKKIEEMEKKIAAMEEEYQEFAAETNEALTEPAGERDLNRKILDNLEKSRPEQYLPAEPDGSAADGSQADSGAAGEQGAQTETGSAGEQKVNPEYTAWTQEYKRFDGLYRSASLSVDILEEKLRQRTELYELDHAYYLAQLEHLKTERSGSVLTAGMSGYVASIQLALYEGQWANGKEPLAAVADTESPELRSDYINKGTVSKAEDIYAIINGKRYEVEYQALDSDEYQRLEELNGAVYSTFTIRDGAEEVAMGSYAVIVVIKQARENVVAVPRDAVRKDDSGSYVYVVDGEESVYTPVKTGMRDGLYTEILSGVSEGDKVLSEQAVVAGDSWTQLERGQISNEFSSGGYCVYLDEERILNPVRYGTCYYVERVAVLYQQVKKGDLLARVRVVPDQVELERNERKLMREQERLADLKAMGEEDNKKAIAAKEKTIRELEELIADFKADFAVTEIRAPRDGIITSVGSFEKEQLLPKDETLFLIADGERSYMVVEDKNGQLAYGNRASIFYDKDGVEQEARGTVVTMNPMGLSKALLADTALILVDQEYIGDITGTVADEDGWWHSFWYDVKVPIRDMDNVLLVPRSAVTEVSGCTYVKVRTEDGGVRYVSFIAGGADSSNYWVAEGLTEGMEICLE